MLGELLKAIKSRWTARALGETFTGGLYEGQSPAGASTPRVVYAVVGNSKTDQATSSSSNQLRQYETATIDLTVHSRGGLSVASGHAETLKGAYDNMHATLSGGVTLHRFTFVGESVVDDPDHPNVKEWTVTYEAVMEAAKTAVNV